MTYIYSRQKNLYDPDGDNQPKIHIYGIGSVGSVLCLSLAKTGFSGISVYDDDIIEMGNIPVQIYRFSDEGKTKTEAMQEICKDFAGIEIEAHNQRIEEGFTFDVSKGSIHILGVDSIESRQFIFNSLRGFQVYFFDTRIGRFEYERFCIDASNSEQCEYYEQSLKGDFSGLPCGMRSFYAVNTIVASLIVRDILKLIQDRGSPAISEHSELFSEITIRRKTK